MTRPNIVRADTIDLQDQDSPSAAEHHRPALQNGLAPHQRAEVHHVLEERNSEEHALADAWKMADDLTEEPGTIDEAQQQHQNTEHPGTNGAHVEHDAGGEAESSEVEGDDDMMDRISSSPSIDDGGYTPHSSPPSFTPRRMVWPERKSSLSPSPRDPAPTPTRETFSQSTSSSLDSSPFLQTPLHLPLHVRRTGKAASPLLCKLDWSSSPLAGSPTSLPTISIEDTDETLSFTSEHHQQTGRYEELLELELDYQAHRTAHEDEGFYENEPNPFRLSMDCQFLSRQDDRNESKTERQRPNPVRKRGRKVLPPIESPFRKNAWAQSLLKIPESNLEESSSLTSMGSVDLQDVLLPIDDPLLDTPPSPSDSGSWESLPASEDDSLENEQIDDDTDALFNNLDDRFIDSGWGGECLRETEDIDFEFVYALHTFVATVEGQANATKGDTMVLLDDSNSYWWLVRVVKDSSIGYLPAEHIETPTERLARLNKHRNIDLSATMLSDNTEKTRNPLKKFQKRKAKAVQFAAPTYVEASDYDYDDDEDETTPEGDLDGVHQDDSQQNGEHIEQAQASENGIAQEEAPRATTPTRGSFDREQAATNLPTSDDPQLSPKLVDKTEAAPLKSRKTRNTDSFLKDDTAETRKITITPGLLREDQAGRAGSSSGETARSSESLEEIVKQVSPPESLSKKDSKKEKEKKKDGFIKSLFKSKKKDKTSKEESEAIDEKVYTDYSPQSPVVSPLASGRNSPGQEPANVMSVVENRALEVQPKPESQDQPQDQAKEGPGAVFAELEGSSAAHEMESLEPPPPINIGLANQEKSKGPLSPITNLLKRDDSKADKPTKAKRAKERVELDDFDSPAVEHSNPFSEEQEDRDMDTDEAEERLSESPVEITPNTFMHGTESVHIPTPGPYDQPGVEDDDDDEPESMTSSPSIIEHPAEPAEATPTAVPDDDDSTPRGPRSPSAAGNEAEKADAQPARNLSTDSTSSSSNRLSPATTVSQQSWSDSSLRAWLEDGSEVKDMMIMIHDKSGVVAVGEDHPLMAGLFTEQKKGVQSMMTELDGLLGSYLQRKGIAFG